MTAVVKGVGVGTISINRRCTLIQEMRALAGTEIEVEPDGNGNYRSTSTRVRWKWCPSWLDIRGDGCGERIFDLK